MKNKPHDPEDSGDPVLPGDPVAPGDPGVELMLAYQAGDEAAFDRLVLSYSAQVYALLTRFLGPRSNREDLVQEVFLRVVRSRERYEGTARFSTWLYRIVFNIAVNETQRQGAKERLDADRAGRASSLGDDEMTEVGDERARDPAHAMEQEDLVRAVRRAIASLPEAQRMALILAKYEELPYVEIGRVLGCSEKAVKSLVHRAREALRESLEPFLHGELS